MKKNFLAIAITAAMFTLAFTEVADAAGLNGKKLNGFTRNGIMWNRNEINAFTVKRGTVNGTQLQSIKVEGGQLVGLCNCR